MSRGAWVFGAFGFGIIALLMLWMGKTLDTKAPIRIERRGPEAIADTPTRTPEEDAAHEERAMRAIVTSRASRWSARAASQIFPSDEAGRVRCSFTGAKPVHRDGDTAWWNAEFSCVDGRQPGALPNLTSVSVRLHRAGEAWVVEN